ncbi:hypothetical protein H6794_03895 [Candidatus Nomurabacteria bacterium]|nr:hypothetical protein [Candidatus Saccharibacteria bacterium]MCB9839972.1 hypothetical protein [Candidatus Nomurabacteria bacterium]
MKAELRNPWLLDESTQFPLPIYPYIDAPSVRTKNGSLYHKDPDDHHFFFPRKLFLSDELGPGGQIVRVSRIQSTRRFYHDMAHNVMAPPPVVDTPDKQFGMSLLALLNYVPRQAINLTNEAPEMVDLNEEEYRLLKKMSRVDFKKEFHKHIGGFFLKTMLSQHVGELDDKLACEFLAPVNHKHKMQTANRIVKFICSQSVEPLEPTVNDLKKEGLIPINQPSPYKTVLKYVRQTRNSTQIVQEQLIA